MSRIGKLPDQSVFGENVSFWVGKIVNVFRRHLIYAEKHGDKTKYDNTGLKGIAAIWAKSHIETKLLENISRYHIDEADIVLLLKESSSLSILTDNSVIFLINLLISSSLIC